MLSYFSLLLVKQLSLCVRYYHSHLPGPHMWPSPGPWPNSQCFKTVEVGCSCEELKPYQREIATDEIQERKNYRERSNIKSARVSALTGSVPRKMAKGQKRVSARNVSRTQVARLSVTLLDHSAIGLCQSSEKNCILLVILLEVFRNLQQLFCMQDCRSRIAHWLNIKARHAIPEFLNANL